MFLEYKGIRIFYEVKGRGSAVVLLHGFLEDKTIWSNITNRLATDYLTISIDLLGHGATCNLPLIYTMEEQAALVTAVLDKHAIHSFSVMGHSMGGYVALALAIKNRSKIKGLCLLNSTPLPDSEERIKNRNRAITIIKQNKTTFIRNAIPFLFSETNKKKYHKEITNLIEKAEQMDANGIIASVEGMKARENHLPFLMETDFNTYLIFGKNDLLIDSNELVNLFKNKQNVHCKILDGGHMSFIEAPQELQQVVLEFLEKS